MCGVYSHFKAVCITHTHTHTHTYIHDKGEVCSPLRSTKFGSKNTHKLILKGILTNHDDHYSCHSDSGCNTPSQIKILHTRVVKDVQFHNAKTDSTHTNHCTLKRSI